MQYTFETAYDQKTLSVMAKCIRKTVRKARSKRSHLFGWLVVALALLLSLSSGEEGHDEEDVERTNRKKSADGSAGRSILFSVCVSGSGPHRHR